MTVSALAMLAGQRGDVATEYKRTPGFALEHAACGRTVPTELLDQLTALNGRVCELVTLEMHLEGKETR